jgi:hypothetical protein
MYKSNALSCAEREMCEEKKIAANEKLSTEREKRMNG